MEHCLQIARLALRKNVRRYVDARLVTQKVANLSLGDQLRFLDLPVGVGTALRQKYSSRFSIVGHAHPQVSPNPTPRALFMSSGDSSINFELRAWTDFANSGQVHSDRVVWRKGVRAAKQAGARRPR